MPQCTATSKRSGERCRRAAMTGRSVCLMHGGRTPRGIASPHYRHGRHSRHLPTRLLATYEEARRDPELLALRDEIALVDARLNELLRDLEGAGEEDRVWRDLLAAIEERRRLVESERRRWVEMRQLVSLDEAAELVRAVTLAVRAHVHDPATLRAIAESVGRLAPLDPENRASKPTK